MRVYGQGHRLHAQALASTAALRRLGHASDRQQPCDNTIRPIAAGKKNWLFAGSERAGRRAAAIQTPVATAKLNGLEPLRWPTEILE
jgi:transposase